MSKQNKDRNNIRLNDFSRAELDKLNHPKLINQYVEERKNDPYFAMAFEAIVSNGLERDVLTKYFIEKKSLSTVAAEVGLSASTVRKYLVDYLLRNYDDAKVEELSVLDANNHFSVLESFFASVLYAAQDAAMNAIFASKVREELAKSMAERGVIGTARNKALMKAWTEASHKLERYGKLANEYMKTYLSLMEKVLDRQRDIAVVRVLYDLLQRLEPEVHERLMQALQEDEYAKAVFQSLPGESLVKTFTLRQNEKDFAKSLEIKAQRLVEEVNEDLDVDL